MKKISLFLSVFVISLFLFIVTPVNAWYLGKVWVKHLDATSKTFDSFSDASTELMDGDSVMLLDNVIENNIVIDKSITLNLGTLGIKSNSITINSNVTITAAENGLMVTETNYTDNMFTFGENGHLTINDGSFYYFKVNYDECSNITINKGTFYYVDYVTRYNLTIPLTSFVEKEVELDPIDEMPYSSFKVNTKKDYIASFDTKASMAFDYYKEEDDYVITNARLRYGNVLANSEANTILDFGSRVDFGLLVRKYNAEDTTELVVSNARNRYPITQMIVEKPIDFNESVNGSYTNISRSFSFDEDSDFDTEYEARIYVLVDETDYYYFGSNHYSIKSIINTYCDTLDKVEYEKPLGALNYLLDKINNS